MSREVLIKHGYVALVDDADYERVALHKWRPYFNSAGAAYAGTVLPGQVYISMHRMLTDAPAGMVVDHVNGNPLDNRRENLRVCTREQNLWNQRRKVGANEHRGVYRVANGKFEVKLQANGKRHNAGRFESYAEACEAAQRLAAQIYGEFSCDLTKPRKRAA